MVLLRIIHRAGLSGQAARPAMCYSRYVSIILWPSMTTLGFGALSMRW